MNSFDGTLLHGMKVPVFSCITFTSKRWLNLLSTMSFKPSPNKLFVTGKTEENRAESGNCGCTPVAASVRWSSADKSRRVASRRRGCTASVNCSSAAAGDPEVLTAPARVRSRCQVWRRVHTEADVTPEEGDVAGINSVTTSFWQRYKVKFELPPGLMAHKWDVALRCKHRGKEKSLMIFVLFL